MLRIACLSDTCKDTSNMAFSYEPNGGMLEDICNGERYRRIADDLGRGSAILGSILATDGICLDKCMFDSQDVGALSCTFVRGAKRERDECMISLCTFGQIQLAGNNNNRVAAKKFKKLLDHISLKAILSRYHAFNAGGGALVKLQDGEIVHFEYACIVGIYADLPAARKLLLTGSACNTCFVTKNEMGDVNASKELRTWENMAIAEKEMRRRIAERDGETASEVRADARRHGIELDVENAFKTPDGAMNLIGPNDDLDNPFSAAPPVFLHGFEMGLLMKLVEASMLYLVKLGHAAGRSETAVCREVDAYCSLVHTVKKRCSNVELGSHPLEPMPHGIAHHILTGKSLDGNKRLTLARLMHGFLATTDLLNPQQRRVHCAMYESAFECREMMLRPVSKDELQYLQGRLNDFDGRLIQYMLEFSPSNCNSEKHHQFRHYAHLRTQLGASALEMAFEHTYAVGFKKQVQYTNKSTTTKCEQTATKHWFRNGIRRLTLALKLRDSAHDNNPPPTTRVVELAHLTPFASFTWPDARAREGLQAKAAALEPPLTFAATSMKITLLNRQFYKSHPRRGVMSVLRAETAGKKVWVDDVRVRYNTDDGPLIGYGKCCGFFMDADETCHAGIQWYRTVGSSSRVNQTTKMVKVELMDSFDYVPAGSIRNGAFLIPLATEPTIGYPKQFWVIQSHREANEGF